MTICRRRECHLDHARSRDSASWRLLTGVREREGAVVVEPGPSFPMQYAPLGTFWDEQCWNRRGEAGAAGEITALASLSNNPHSCIGHTK